MKLLTVPWPALLLVVACPASVAGEDVDRALEVPADALVRIKNTRGEVSIEGTASAEVRVYGELDDLAEALVFEVSGKDVIVEVRMPRQDVNWGDGSNLSVTVPHTVRLSFEGVSTDVEANNISGGMQLRTVSGDIEVEQAGTQLVLNSVSGDIKVRDAAGRAKVTTISGDIDLEMTAADVTADSVSGDINLDLALFDRLRTNSVSGETEASGTLAQGGRIDMSSVSGEIELVLGRPVNGKFNVRTSMGGEIDNDINGELPKKGFPSQQELNMSVGDGSADININTVSGEIRLR